MALRRRQRFTMRLDHHCTSTLKLRGLVWSNAKDVLIKAVHYHLIPKAFAVDQPLSCGLMGTEYHLDPETTKDR